jgi:hypothetical protein
MTTHTGEIQQSETERPVRVHLQLPEGRRLDDPGVLDSPHVQERRHLDITNIEQDIEAVVIRETESSPSSTGRALSARDSGSGPASTGLPVSVGNSSSGSTLDHVQHLLSAPHRRRNQARPQSVRDSGSGSTFDQVQVVLTAPNNRLEEVS